MVNITAVKIYMTAFNSKSIKKRKPKGYTVYILSTRHPGNKILLQNILRTS